jgi:hypothetical protein
MSGRLHHDAVGDVVDVLRLDVGEVALLLGHLHVEQAEVGLRGDRLEGGRALDAGRAARGGRDVARVGRRADSDRGLLEVAVRRAGGRRARHALDEDALAANDVGDFRLVLVHHDGAVGEGVGRSAHALNPNFDVPRHGRSSFSMRVSGWGGVA